MYTPTIWGQQNKPAPLNFGLEQDVLPYILKGYIITGWIGRDYSRYRFSYAQASTPKLMLGDGILSEYFFKDNFKGWWLGPGIGYWTNTINTVNNEKATHEGLVFSLGGGYNHFLTNWLYVTPWFALHSRVSSTKEITIGNNTYQPMLFTPEVSVKLGIKLPMGKN